MDTFWLAFYHLHDMQDLLFRILRIMKRRENIKVSIRRMNPIPSLRSGSKKEKRWCGGKFKLWQLSHKAE